MLKFDLVPKFKEILKNDKLKYVRYNNNGDKKNYMEVDTTFGGSLATNLGASGVDVVRSELNITGTSLFELSHQTLYTQRGANILWMSGDLPVEEKDWNRLKQLKIEMVFNFSDWSLKRRSGFEIINFMPHIISLTMPMTEQEIEMVSNFIHVIGLAHQSTRLYICGGSRYRAILALILGKKRDLKLQIDDGGWLSTEDVSLLDKFS